MAKSHAGSNPAIGIINKKMNTELIKHTFLNFFKKNFYIELPPSPLILENDKSLLFTNSGMVQFKNIFLGLEPYIAKRITTIQPCVRLGGKHNDLDNIGKTPHHNTSFEMLGNFGFEEVKKEEAINLAIDFLINNLNINKEKLFITVNKNDNETFDIWAKHIKKSKIILGDNNTNFWQMAENGPCGYCSEIFYNLDEDKTNLLEIWNIVFINFNKKNGKLSDLNKIHIDTGMGLERIASIKQNVFDNFETDTYLPLIKNTINTLKVNESEKNSNIRIITDHLKTCIILINENVIPSNDGRGYILKKLIRRAIIKKQELKTKIKLYNLIDPYSKYIKNLNQNLTSIIKEIIKKEEIKFDLTISNGKSFIKKLIQKEKIISGKTLFTLYDTYGTPIDIIEKLTKESNIKIELNEFKKELETQIKANRIRSKKINNELIYTNNLKETNFIGYSENIIDTIVLKIIKNNKESQDIHENEDGIIITKDTTFYAEKGGQTSDTGTIEFSDNIFEVKETKDINNVFFHYGKMKKGFIRVDSQVKTKIDTNKRQLIANNHSATHLLHTTLKKLLGNHIKQSGSLINEKYLRFDFIHFNQLSINDKKTIEYEINQKIKEKLDVKIEFLNEINLTTQNEKIKNRLVKIGENVSIELCAGTHVKNTSEIGLFKITKEYGIGSNIRRIEAITNIKIMELLDENENIIDNIINLMKTKKEKLLYKIENLIEKKLEIEKINQTLLIEKIKDKITKAQRIKLKNNIDLIKITANLITIFNTNKLIENIKNTIIINLFENKDKLLIKIIITPDIVDISAAKILNDLTNKMDCVGGGNNKIANGIIYNNKDINKIINYIQLYLNNF